jgi:transmembrane sensor
MSIDRIYEEAAGWLVRQQDDAMDWEGFTLWLEADPRHRAAYDDLALLDADLDTFAQRFEVNRTVPAPVAANDAEPVRWKRWAGVGGGALAAGLALALVLQPATSDIRAQDYRSAPGESAQVALADGGHVVLAPDSHLRVRGGDITIEGTGYFDVPHRPGRTLTVNAGDFQVTDIGTRFSVANEVEGVSVEVEEGALSVSSQRLGSPIALHAGHGLHADRSSATVQIVSVEPQRIATWRNGKLQFDEVPLALVARDISRYSGRKVTVDRAIAGQPFSGVIAIDQGEAPEQTLAQILSLDIQRVDGASRLRPRR